MVIIFYFFLIRPENKKKKKAEEMRNSLSVGDQITTIGGIIGRIVAVKSESIVFETSEDRVRVEVAKWCANKVSVPVSIHLDHGSDFDICMQALKLGFTSVMIDGSTKPIEENAAMTQEVVKVAKAFDVPVEAEIGELQRLDNGVVMENKNIADPEQVRQFLSLCNPDTLAIGIGNAHGYYKGKPDIKLEVLEAVRQFSDIPLVLHGCTGMEESIIKDAIGEGMARERGNKECCDHSSALSNADLVARCRALAGDAE
jgi:ketose-bisphosphate aldolase